MRTKKEIGKGSEGCNLRIPAFSELPMIKVVQPAYQAGPNGGQGSFFPSASLRFNCVRVFATTYTQQHYTRQSDVSHSSRWGKAKMISWFATNWHTRYRTALLHSAGYVIAMRRQLAIHSLHLFLSSPSIVRFEKHSEYSPISTAPAADPAMTERKALGLSFFFSLPTAVVAVAAVSAVAISLFYFSFYL